MPRHAILATSLGPHDGKQRFRAAAKSTFALEWKPIDVYNTNEAPPAVNTHNYVFLTDASLARENLENYEVAVKDPRTGPVPPPPATHKARARLFALWAELEVDPKDFDPTYDEPVWPAAKINLMDPRYARLSACRFGEPDQEHILQLTKQGLAQFGISVLQDGPYALENALQRISALSGKIKLTAFEADALSAAYASIAAAKKAIVANEVGSEKLQAMLEKFEAIAEQAEGASGGN